MKNVKTFLIIAFITLAGTVSAQSAMAKWPAIKDFHEAISQTFHPAEEGNLAPVKARAEELMKKANEIASSEIPASFKTDAMQKSVKNLQLKSTSLFRVVNSKGTDDAIMKSLSEVHDAFHEIVGLCSEKK
jgi:hypothetical protein